jgi:soluble lytic murein transglycosylase-like protein
VTRYRAEIEVAAKAHQLDPLLVEALVLKESSGNTDSFRWERNFWNRYLKAKPEWRGQNPRRVSSSYGLMQIMYPVALERDYPKDWPPEYLFVPEVGLEYGCRQLRMLIDWAEGVGQGVGVDRRLQAVLASYNGGRGGNHPVKDNPLRNAAYAHSMLGILATLKAQTTSSVAGTPTSPPSQ